VGRRWGKTKWPWSERKSIVGTSAFVAGAFAVSLAEVAWFNQV
jgi:dolichol kinase